MKSDRRERSSALSELATEESIVRRQVPTNRRDEIARYLKLFGYKPERTVLEAHVAGSFGHRPTSQAETMKRAAQVARYGGRTFTVLGRCHDPEFLARLIPPKTGKGDVNPGYKGYLFAGKDEDMLPPHELLPLDFVPASLRYPEDWKKLFGTKGFLISMHVPSNFTRGKNEIHRRLSRIKGDVDPKKKWNFLEELEEFGYYYTNHGSVS